MLHLQTKSSLCQQLSKEAIKLVAVSTIFTSMTEKKIEELEQVPCIWYLVIFKNKTEALLDLRRKVNATS